jgi:anaerobic magnesium-protoporphyrin IX monomethyl ester cyclase
VLLVDPYVAREDPMERKFVELYPSIGLLTLGAYLRGRGAAVEILDLTFERDSRRVSSRIASFRPHVVGVHTKTLTRRRSFFIARRAEEAGAVPVSGGPDAATEPRAYLDAGFRAVAMGEGEGVLLDIARAARDGRTLAGIPGVVAEDRAGRLVRGPVRPVIRDLDELPLPAWDLIDMEAYLRAWQAKTGERRAAVLTSRGCPFDCSWCSKPVFGRTFRQQSPGRVLDELEALHRRYGVDYVRFCDDVFGIRRAWLEELLDGFRERGLDLKFECLARVDLLKTDLLDRLRAAGLQRVYVGVESGSQKMLDLMNRGTRLAQVERVATELRRAGIRQFWFLMLGYPGETLGDIEATLALFRRFSPEEYSVSIAVPVPGTRFFEAVRARLRERREGRRARDGGRDLLFEAAYPESLYRWEQARFAWEAALGRARGRVPDRMLRALSRAADRMDRRLARPLLLGAGSAASDDGPTGPGAPIGPGAR